MCISVCLKMCMKRRLTCWNKVSGMKRVSWLPTAMNCFSATKWLTLMNSDDVCLPDYLRVHLRWLYIASKTPRQPRQAIYTSLCKVWKCIWDSSVALILRRQFASGKARARMAKSKMLWAGWQVLEVLCFDEHLQIRGSSKRSVKRVSAYRVPD